MQIYSKSARNQIIFSCHPFKPDDVMRHFDYIPEQLASIKNNLPGRGQVHFIKDLDQRFVLRHYVRGGFIKRLLGDNYFYINNKNSRAWRELKLLQYLKKHDFPVPAPAACRIQHRGIFYKADLLMFEIPNSQPLSHCLHSAAMSEKMWCQLGEMIGKFHVAGICHVDLNAHNILIDQQQKIWLIDFDRAAIKKPTRHWQLTNLKRLHRSLSKLRKSNSEFHFVNTDWQLLLEGYRQVNKTSSEWVKYLWFA